MALIFVLLSPCGARRYLFVHCGGNTWQETDSAGERREIIILIKKSVKEILRYWNGGTNEYQNLRK